MLFLGGEIASFILIDACVRLIPEVLGNKNSLVSESFQNHLIEYPQYTKPQGLGGFKGARGFTKWKS